MAKKNKSGKKSKPGKRNLDSMLQNIGILPSDSNKPTSEELVNTVNELDVIANRLRLWSKEL